MWELEPHDDFERRVKHFQKRHRREFQNVLDNLDTFYQSLRAGAKPHQIKRGFIHPEPHGVLAIDQKGKGKHLKEVRLYIYPDERKQVLHVIIIGDKDSQKDDIALCSGFVNGLQTETVDDLRRDDADNEQETDQTALQEHLKDVGRRVG